MRIATWNINSISVRLCQILTWLQNQKQINQEVDILCLQELKSTDDKFPFEAIDKSGYTSLVNGQKAYNGVAILINKNSKWQAHGTVLKQIPDSNFKDLQKRIIAINLSKNTNKIIGFDKNQESKENEKLNFIRIICAYFPNGQDPHSEKFNYKLAWLESLYNWLKTEIKDYPNLAILGDFNIAPRNEDVYAPELSLGKNLVSPEERAAFNKIISLGLNDAFLLFKQKSHQFSWWDYRNASFRRNLGMRIDHILLSNLLTKKCINCIIDTKPRSFLRPSDHAPVLATLCLG